MADDETDLIRYRPQQIIVVPSKVTEPDKTSEVVETFRLRNLIQAFRLYETIAVTKLQVLLYTAVIFCLGALFITVLITLTR